MSDHIGEDEDAVLSGPILGVGIIDLDVAKHLHLPFGFALVFYAFVAA
jgi:hypothetical protein